MGDYSCLMHVGGGLSRLQSGIRPMHLAEILASLHDRGLTLITVLHEMGELSDVVERAVVLVEGRISADGPAHDLAPSSPGAACHGGRPCS